MLRRRNVFETPPESPFSIARYGTRRKTSPTMLQTQQKSLSSANSAQERWAVIADGVRSIDGIAPLGNDDTLRTLKATSNVSLFVR
jgi:hypothetical protein